MQNHGEMRQGRRRAHSGTPTIRIGFEPAKQRGVLRGSIAGYLFQRVPEPCQRCLAIAFPPAILDSAQKPTIRLLSLHSLWSKQQHTYAAAMRLRANGGVPS